MIVGYSKGSYSGTTLQPFQGLCQVNGGSPAGWFLVSFIIIIYVKDKIHGVKIKTATTGDNFKIVTVIFFDNR